MQEPAINPKGSPRRLLIVDCHSAGAEVLSPQGHRIAQQLQGVSGFRVLAVRSCRAQVIPAELHALACGFSPTGDIPGSLPQTREGEELARIVASLGASQETGAHRVPILFLGPMGRIAELTEMLTGYGLRRSSRFVLHTPCDNLPLGNRHGALFRQMDAIVVESAFAARAVERCCENARPRIRRPIEIIPPGPADTQATPGPRVPRVSRVSRERADVGRPGLGCNGFVVFSPVSDRAPAIAAQAMQVFRLLVRSELVVCSRCHRATAFEVIPETLERKVPGACRHCASPEVLRPETMPDARMLLHLDPDLSLPVIDALTHLLVAERDRFGLADRVVITGGTNGENSPGRDVSAFLVREADAYLSCHEGTWVHPTFFEAKALGLPIVAPNFGAAREETGDGVTLVPTGFPFFTATGYLKASTDLGAAALALGRALRSVESGSHPPARERDSLNLAWARVLTEPAGTADRIPRFPPPWLGLPFVPESRRTKRGQTE